MEAQGERIYSSYSFMTSALDGGEWSASRPGRALAPGSYWTGGWLGLRGGLDREARVKILFASGDRSSIVWSSSPFPDTTELPRLLLAIIRLLFP
jgi:hypothetical protein